MVPDVLLHCLARIGAAALPVRLREQVRDWDRLDELEREAARGELDRLAGAVAAGRG